MSAFIARQPIFDRKQNVYGYELLFRDGLDNVSHFEDGDRATSVVLNNGFFSIGINELTKNKRAFVNFTSNLLLNETATIFPKDWMVVEILESIPPENDIIAACRKLKEAGYMLVLDDFVFDPSFSPLINLADIIKVDFLTTDSQERKSVIEKVNSQNVKFLAEKVETQIDFQEGLGLGYKYFQGYFFSRPDIIQSKEIPAYKNLYLKILKEIHEPEPDFKKLEQIIKQDVGLSYRFLRLINSAAFGIQNRVNSIKQGLVLLGIEEMKKWVSVIVLSSLGEDKPHELIVNSFVRASFLENLAHMLGMQKQASNMFLLGLFSMIDALVNRPKSEIFSEISISEEVKNALLGNDNYYKRILELLICYEKGEWARFANYSRELGVNEKEIAKNYFKTIKETNKIF